MITTSSPSGAEFLDSANATVENTATYVRYLLKAGSAAAPYGRLSSRACMVVYDGATAKLSGSNRYGVPLPSVTTILCFLMPNMNP